MQEGTSSKSLKEGDDVLLESEWTIWHERVKVDQGGLNENDYMQALSNVGSFNSLKEFWRLWGTISFESAGTVHIFKTGIKPIWEDPANQNGGKWVVTINQEHEDHQRVMQMWFSLVVAVFCGQLEHSSDMCGIVLAVRNWGTGLHIWNMHAGDTEKQDAVKQNLHKLLKTKKIKYIRHQMSIQKNNQTSDSEGSKPRNWGEKRRIFNYDSEHKSRAGRSSPPTVQDGSTRTRRFSVGSEAKPDMERPNLAPPAKNPWNAPKFGAPPSMESVAEEKNPETAPAPEKPAPVPHKNPWNVPPKASSFLASSTDSAPTSTPEPTPTPTPAPVSTPATSDADTTSTFGQEAPVNESVRPSFAPTNPWKKLPTKAAPEPTPTPEPKKQTTEKQPTEKKPTTEKQAEKQSKKIKDKQDDDAKFVKPAPVVPKPKPASSWDGRKVIKTLETAGESDFMPIDQPVKVEKVNKPPQNKRRNYTTDPSSGEEDNKAKRAIPRPQPLPQAITTAPVFSTPAPPHPTPSTTAPSTSTSTTTNTPAPSSEWSVIADKPKRKLRAGAQEASQSDREAYARPRQQQQYELLEGIEEEEARAERERVERAERAAQQQKEEEENRKATEEVEDTKEEDKEGEGEEPDVSEEIPFVPPPSQPTIASLMAANANAAANPSPSKSTPTRRRRELGVRHNASKGSGNAATTNAEAAAAQAAKENLKVLIVAPCAMLAILLLVYILFF